MPPVLAEPEELTIIELPEAQTGGPNGGGPGHPGQDDHGGGGDGDDEPDDSGYMPDLGILGMRLMLVSITTLFIALGMIYLARSRTPKFWEPVRVPDMLWLSTGIILTSSWTLEIARGYMRKRETKGYTEWLCATVLLGVAFLCSQLYALRQLMAQGLYLRHNPHSSMFFIITGVHGVHLLAGIAMLLYLLIRHAGQPRQQARMAVATMYWHVLDGLWVAMFVLLLVLGR